MKKSYHLCVYVENNSQKVKKFRSLKALRKFVADFESTDRKHSDTHWIDFTVEKINGEFSAYDQSVQLEVG